MHTNHTTNYELSQFVSSDKPTFLGDYNGDMLKIDTAIAGVGVTASGADSKADSAIASATAAASTASDAATLANTANTNANSALTTAGNAATAASAAQSTAESAASAASTADGKAVAAQGNIGDLTQLTTTDKTNLVNAINEVNAKTPSVGVELTESVAQGATSVTFTNAAITAGAKLLLFFDDVFIPYSAVSVGTGTVTYTIEETTAAVTATLWVV